MKRVSVIASLLTFVAARTAEAAGVQVVAMPPEKRDALRLRYGFPALGAVDESTAIKKVENGPLSNNPDVQAKLDAAAAKRARQIARQSKGMKHDIR